MCFFSTGLPASIENELPEVVDPVEAIEMVEVESVDAIETVQPVSIDFDATVSRDTFPMFEIVQVETIDTFEPITMDIDAVEPMEVDPIAVEIGQDDETQAVASVQHHSFQAVDVNNLLHARPIGVRRLSELMPSPMPSIKEENENEDDKENRQPDKAN